MKKTCNDNEGNNEAVMRMRVSSRQTRVAGTAQTLQRPAFLIGQGDIDPFRNKTATHPQIFLDPESRLLSAFNTQTLAHVVKS